MTSKTWAALAKRYIKKAVEADNWIASALETGEVRVIINKPLYEGWEAEFDFDPIVVMDCEEMPMDRYDSYSGFIHATGRLVSWDFGETWEVEYEDIWTADCESI